VSVDFVHSTFYTTTTTAIPVIIIIIIITEHISAMTEDSSEFLDSLDVQGDHISNIGASRP